MVTSVTKYRCRDGAEFREEKTALAHEVFLDEIQTAMAPLGECIDGCDFLNGIGYIQHSEKAVLSAFMEIVVLVEREIRNLPEDWRPLTILKKWEYRRGIVGRFIDDNHPILWREWIRFTCIDDLFREWGQQYHAVNSDSRKEFCLADRVR